MRGSAWRSRSARAGARRASRRCGTGGATRRPAGSWTALTSTHHDVVELEALHLADVGHLDAGAEGELLGAHAAQVRDLGAAQALVVASACSGWRASSATVARGSRADERAQRLGQERDRRARRRESGGPRPARRSAGPRAARDRRAGPGVARDRQDLARRAVGDAQRLDRDVARAPRCASTPRQSRKPLSRNRRCEVSPASVIERARGVVWRRSSTDELERRQILRLVDEEVRASGCLVPPRHASW